MRARWFLVATGLLVAACSGGTVDNRLATAEVQLSWSANREVAVNSAGGGYRVYYAQQPNFSIATANVVDVPYVSGAAAPTNTTVTLLSGHYYVKVVAYSALNPSGSSPSAEFSFVVPLR